MSANPQAVRRTVSSPQGSSSVQAPSARPGTPRLRFYDDREAPSMRLNLSDIEVPRVHAQLDVEGFRPSLLSRIFDLIAPIKKK
jgi:hypothetical protein